MAKGFEFRILKVEEMHYLCSENKDADQLHCYRATDLHLCLHISTKQAYITNHYYVNAPMQHTRSYSDDFLISAQTWIVGTG